jgi:hypothetical protein
VKNKKLTYILLPAVILIWGMIVYRVMNASPSGTRVNEAFHNESAAPAVVNDTFSLLANYRDPFRTAPAKKIMTSSGSEVKSSPVKEKKVTTPVVSSWPQIVYGGLIRNQQSKKELAMVQVNGQGNFMRTGDIAGDVRLLKVFKDSIIVSFGKEKKSIRK